MACDNFIRVNWKLHNVYRAWANAMYMVWERETERESKWAWNEWKRNSFVWVKNKGKIIVWPRPCQKRVEREKWKRKQQQQRRPEERAYQRNARKQVEKQKWLCANIKINSIYFYFIFHLIVHGFFSFASLRKRSCFSQFSPHFSFGHFCCEVFALGFFFLSLSHSHLSILCIKSLLCSNCQKSCVVCAPQFRCLSFVLRSTGLGLFHRIYTLTRTRTHFWHWETNHNN